MKPRPRVVATGLLAVLSGCQPAPPPAEPAASVGPARTPGNARTGILGAFLADYWRLPIPLQGAPPEGWSSVEASLDPATCGACHPQQLAEWRTSLHAGAYSPGFSGQLIEGALARPHALRRCQTCHAPLEEQQPVLDGGAPSPHFDAALRDHGIVCAACHVRAHRRFGPPRRAGVPAPQGAVAHGGFEARDAFGQSRFCAPCHQFFDQEGPAGKPVENTFVEWRESVHAAEGRSCQSCHMPDRAHTWRGIHDPAMVRDAVDVALSAPAEQDGGLRATLALTNRGVGHAFPTYVTPRVHLAVWQADAAGEELPETRRDAKIGREVDFRARPARERFDTRVMPGETFRLEYAAPRHVDAVSLRARVGVDPAHHYRGVFERLLARYRDPSALARIEEALARAERAAYVLVEPVRPLPVAPSGGRGGKPAT